MTVPIRVFLADDHAIRRASLKAVLNAEPDIHVIGEAGDGEEAVERTEQLAPDVVVMDLDMPRLDGLAATRAITAQEPGPAVLVVTMLPAARFLLRVLDAGGAGYVEKDAPASEIARELYLSAKTVEVYRQQIMQKLGPQHRTELVQYALRTGLLQPSG